MLPSGHVPHLQHAADAALHAVASGHAFAAAHQQGVADVVIPAPQQDPVQGQTDHHWDCTGSHFNAAPWQLGGEGSHERNRVPALWVVFSKANMDHPQVPTGAGLLHSACYAVQGHGLSC